MYDCIYCGAPTAPLEKMCVECRGAEKPLNKIGELLKKLSIGELRVLEEEELSKLLLQNEDEK